jgi:hypothetical protein
MPGHYEYKVIELREKRARRGGGVDPDAQRCRIDVVVRVAGERTSSGGPDRLEESGYRCVRTGSEQDPLPVSRYECTNGSRKVTFTRS